MGSKLWEVYAMNHNTRPVIRAKQHLANYAFAAFRRVIAPFRLSSFHHSTCSRVGSGSFFTQSWQHGLIFIGALSILLLISPSLLAAGIVDPEFGGEGYGEGALLASVEALNITLALIATALFLAAARRLAPSREGIALFYLAGGIALLGMTRVFYIVADRGAISVHDDTHEFWWHMIFFMAMIMCIFGGKVLSNIDGSGDRLNSRRALWRWGVISALLTVTVFLTAEALDKPFMAIFDNTIWDTFGVQHFAAFVVSAIALLHIFASVAVNESRSRTGVIAHVKIPLMITYGLFSVDHFWELLTESWEIFLFPETLIERVEQIIVLPAFVAVTYAGWKLRASRPQVQKVPGTLVES